MNMEGKEKVVVNIFVVDDKGSIHQEGKKEVEVQDLNTESGNNLPLNTNIGIEGEAKPGMVSSGDLNSTK